MAALGVATVYEASGRDGLVDAELVQVVPGSRVAGPARTVLCGQNDNLGVQQALAHAATGEVLVVTMPQPTPVALVGDLLALQANVRGIAAMLIDAAVRDRDELAGLGLPIWARWIRAAGADKQFPGKLDTTVVVGGQRIAPGDYVVMNADGAVAVAKDRVADVVEAAQQRHHNEAAMRERLAAGEPTLDLLGLRR
ncbi:MAG: dimethylmenaquinone methyltransferase [Thermoleophilaceae bacterium]|nr:dimethylmenaquinone methyltransferase [Thermoleophilaceae bacterium]